MKYVVFIDYNKETMRSKEKRRSNKFYSEMARFIKTRNALQCRSHHQKLEEKYIHANKIIAVFKNAYDRREYKQAMENLGASSAEHLESKPSPEVSPPPVRVEVEIQTDIQGVGLQFVHVGPSTVMIAPPNMPIPPQPYPQMGPGLGMMGENPQPPPFGPNPFGWWGGNYNNYRS